MFPSFFAGLREAKIPVSLKEYLMLMEALAAGEARFSMEEFYYLSRSALVKDERYLDRFDQVFGEQFKGIETSAEEMQEIIASLPEEWLRKLAEKHLSPEEMAEIEAMGGFEKLMETLKERLAEQEKRHQGGNKWIGTAGTSPFGAYGYNPEGVRIGQDKSRHQRAVKVWDKREFKNLDDSIELGTRNIKVALRRLRQFARTGAPTELDLDGTVQSTAENAGWLDIKMRPERHNAAKVLLFFDVGGSMDPFIRICEELFSAARSEFKHLEYFYFHNCPYERLWQDNARRRQDVIPTMDVLHTYGSDYRVIFVGDAAMSPYEITHPGGSVEHWNEIAGGFWLQQLRDTFPHSIWLNPTPERYWGTATSTTMIRQLFEDRMYPMTLDGLDRAMRVLGR
ncbi:MAG: VWA domain-containing protein [Pseudomonadota bacterium]